MGFMETQRDECYSVAIAVVGTAHVVTCRGGTARRQSGGRRLTDVLVAAGAARPHVGAAGRAVSL
jgi:hypothetical protein